MGLPTPYYDDGHGIVIYLGDCREILPHLPKVDLVLTDPPYGMALDTDYSGFNGWNGKGLVHAEIIGDGQPFDPKPFLIAQHHIFWGAQYFCHALPESGGWLVFNKRGDGAPSEICFGDCELAWADMMQSVRMFSRMWHGVARWSSEGVLHPSQKPIELMKWCIGLAKTASGTILDPFMGSGTTLRAAKDLGRQCIGIEIEEKYCEIAARRLGQEVLPL